MICTNCHVLCKDVCPICGKSKRLREPEADDPVFLMTLSNLKALFVEPIMDDNRIVYNRIGTLGAGLTARWGTAGEMYRYYVPFSEYEHVCALVEEIFGEDEEIMRALHEFDLND